MPDARQPVWKRADDIDIARSPLFRWFRPNVTEVTWLVILVAVAAVIYTALGLDKAHPTMAMAVIVGTAIVITFGLIAWNPVFRRGLLTWMRLARAPARAMARGDSAAAEQLFGKAMARADRFAPQDHRRGLMLSELAMYVKNQGRAADATNMFEESVTILGQHARRSPIDYFIALNNAAIHFIHLRDVATAQRYLERALDQTLLRRTHGPAARGARLAAPAASNIELILQLNLAFLFLQMHEVTEAADHMKEAGELLAELAAKRRIRFHDHYQAMRGLLRYAEGRFADAAHEVELARDANYPACLRVRAKLHLVRQEFAEAERLSRQYADFEGKKGSLHRPELRDHLLDLAEGLFGQGKVDEAMATMREALSIVADFALPADVTWRRALEGWLRRAPEARKDDMRAALAAELDRIATMPEHGITISDRLRIRSDVR
jgi:tetratricopeptide (TPR) repeat protein